jgi:hypothetical protein
MARMKTRLTASDSNGKSSRQRQTVQGLLPEEARLQADGAWKTAEGVEDLAWLVRECLVLAGIADHQSKRIHQQHLV